METQRSYHRGTGSHASLVPVLFPPVSYSLFNNEFYCGTVVEHHPCWGVTIMRRLGSSRCCNKTWPLITLVNMADELIYPTLWPIAIFGFTEYSDIDDPGSFHLCHHHGPLDLDHEKERIWVSRSACRHSFIWHDPMPLVVGNKISAQINCIQHSFTPVHRFYQRQQVLLRGRQGAWRPKFPSTAFAYISPGGVIWFSASSK